MKNKEVFTSPIALIIKMEECDIMTASGDLDLGNYGDDVELEQIWF